LDFIVDLPKEVAEEMAADLNGDALKSAEMYRSGRRDGGSVYSGFTGELARIQRSLLNQGVAYKNRGFVVLDRDYEASLDVLYYIL